MKPSIKFACEKGKIAIKNKANYCKSCDKTLHDFRGKTNAEILENLSEMKHMPCGIFNRNQLQAGMHLRIHLNHVASLSVYKIVAIAALVCLQGLQLLVKKRIIVLR